MPSIGKLRFVDVHEEVIEQGVLQVVYLVVHADYHYAVFFPVVILVRCWIVEWLEDLH